MSNQFDTSSAFTAIHWLVNSIENKAVSAIWGNPDSETLIYIIRKLTAVESALTPREKARRSRILTQSKERDSFAEPDDDVIPIGGCEKDSDCVSKPNGVPLCCDEGVCRPCSEVQMMEE